MIFNSFIDVTVYDVVPIQGDSYSNASADINFMIGEAMIKIGTDGTNDLIQGFHQTNWIFAGLEDHSRSY